jgi:HlyD family type I secretion membrane fusion protein
LLARKSRLDTEQKGKQIIKFPDELTGDNENITIQRMMADKIALFESRKNTRLGQQGMMKQKISQLEDQVHGLKSQVNSKIKQSEILAASILLKKPAAKRGVISQDTVDQLKLRHVELIGKVGELQSNVARVGGTIIETELQILQIDIDFREKVHEELRKVTSQLAEVQEQKSALEEKLRRTRIISPVAGRVFDISIHTVGGIVEPAKPILQIMPDNDRLIIEARIQTIDIDQVHIGQAAAVSLTAFDTRTTPVLDAKVAKISASQLVDKATNVPYYTVEILLLKDQISRLEEDQILLPGMPTEIFLRTSERSPLDYLLKPLMVQIMKAFKET